MNRLLRRFLLINMLFVYFVINVNAQDITTGLVAHYEFEETSLNTNAPVADAAGSHNASIVGSGISSVTGMVGNAFSFDGLSYVKIDSHSDITNYSAFTLSAWVSPTTLSSHRTIISKVTSGRDFVLKFYNTTLQAHFYDGGYKVCNGTTAVPTGEWKHVLCTWSNNQWKIYYNGTLESTCDHTGYDPPWSSSLMSIGALDSGEKFIGSIDEVRVYNRALTADDVTALFNYAGGSSTSDIIAHYKLDGESGSVIDELGNNNGTNYGALRGEDGIIENSFSFDGTNDYVSFSCGDGGFCDFAGNNFSAGAWIKTNDTNGSIGGASSSISDLWDFGVNGGKAYFTFNCGNNTSPTGIATTTVNDNTWHHIIVVRDGVRDGKIYVDGNLEHSWNIGGTYTAIDITTPFYLGRNPSGNYFAGQIDQVKIYDKALTASEVQTEYSEGVVTANTSLWTEHSNGTDIYYPGKVGIGTESPDELLTVSGTIHCQEVIIDSNIPAPDYVFDDQYNLRSIKSLEKFLKKNSHLPDIPSAQKMESNGVRLSELNLMLLKQIEELTLYIIDQEKRIVEIESGQSKRIEK